MKFGGRRWCGHVAEQGHAICANHRLQHEAAAVRRENERAREVLIQNGVRNLLEMNPIPSWRNVVEEMAEHPLIDVGYAIAFRYYLAPVHQHPPNPHMPMAWNFRRYWTWVIQGRIGIPPQDIFPGEPPPPPAPELQRLARDAQNVHTAVVSAQTNTGMEKILATAVPKDQQTEKVMIRAWMPMLTTVGWTSILKTANDINYWFNMKTCRAPNDNLYRNMLRGLVAMINRTDDELKNELFKRLWEECRESTGLCCEGHITRLCNVMVGFDDAFKPPVALGELMQQKMAAIAGLEVEEEEKRRQATAWFDEMAVPVPERVAWLDAFA